MRLGGEYRAAIANVAPAIDLGVSIHYFSPNARFRRRDAVIKTRNGGKVTCDNDRLVVSTPSDEDENRIFPIVSRQPLKSSRVIVPAVKSVTLAIKSIEISNQRLHAAMKRKVQQIPLYRSVTSPLIPLRDFSAHKEKLFTRKGPHPREISTQIGKFLPIVPGHLAYQRAFSVHDLIMR